ncbi:MAG: peptide chain release factor N(5)-glutamine methyltransferase [Lentisphaeria bacterium]|nr:peptide chain release factor N(5)-glutamine methyltransferase [Lentisphaeria bacterium]
MTFLELKKKLTERFSQAGFEAADLEAHYIVCEAAGIPDREFALHAHEETPSDVPTRAESFLARRLTNEPWQYVFGHAPFRNLELAVGPGCLIPRPETEYSIDLMLDGLPRGASVCELGTGSGAISLALASERPDLTVVGTELSPAALKWAELNLKRLALPNVTFLRGDLFAPVAGRKFDLIAANLPYIPEGDRGKLPPNVRDFEPDEALFGGADGLDVIARALEQAPAFLTPVGRVFFELDPCNADRALELASNYLRTPALLHDQYGAVRFLTGRTCPPL